MSERETTDSAALAKADQAAWEAPELRSTFTPGGGKEQWAFPCPDWCTGDGEGHDLDAIMGGVRKHESASLLVRQDAAYGYWDEESLRNPTTEGMRSAHIEVLLEQRSRAHDDPTIRMVVHFGKTFPDGAIREKEFRIAQMYPDEVRELITVLQHLLRVAGA